MRVADAILRYLKAYNVQYAFGIPALNVSPIFDAMNDIRIKPVIAKNSCGAAYMAAKYASASKNIALCIGNIADAYNMVSGAEDAMSSKVPVFFITCCLESSNNKLEDGKKKIIDIFKEITKFSQSIDNKIEVLDTLGDAIKAALRVPQGPVHISIPAEILLDEIEDETIIKSLQNLGTETDIITMEADDKEIKQAAKLINSEEKGIILIGKGCRGFSEFIIELSENLYWPIITTPGGKGAVSDDYHMNLGTYSYFSTDAARDYIIDNDMKCILVLGDALGEISDKNSYTNLIKGRQIIAIDLNGVELNKFNCSYIKISGNLKTVIPELIKMINKPKSEFIKPFLNKWDSRAYKGLSLKTFLDKLPSFMPLDTFYVCDAGENNGFVFKYLCVPVGGDFEINMNHQVIGSGLAGAIGVHLANEKRTVAVLACERSFFMNVNEIFTAKEYGMPIIYFIINNSVFLESEQAHLYLYGRTLREFTQKNTNICELMTAWGIKAIQIRNINEIDMIGDFITKLDGPAVVELITDKDEILPSIRNSISLKIAGN